MKTKSELKKDYKLNPPAAGIFQIKNLVNGKVFLGSAENISGIINRHKFELKMGCHRNRDLQDDWNRHGEQNFEFGILEIVNEENNPDFNYSEELAVYRELWFEKVQPYGDRGYHKSGSI
jgi:hypothetical protein